jgi:2-oxoisovalerate dehydrogenase E1 component
MRGLNEPVPEAVADRAKIIRTVTMGIFMKDNAGRPIAAAEKGRLPAREFLHLMLMSRECDRREAILMRQGKAWISEAGMGHESTAALAYHLEPQDYFFGYCRDRPLYLGCGVPPEQIARDFFARSTSTTQGRLMPQHCSLRELNIFPGVTAQGAECLPAVGAAWAMKLSNDPAVVLCTIGDAATRQGEFYEALCFAVQERLPVVFVVEDNGFGISTRTKTMMPLRLGVIDAQLAAKVNGRNAFEVFEEGGRAIAKARAGGGPTVLWCDLDRLAPHTSADDHRVYRSSDEIAQMQERDPIKLLSDALIEGGLLTTEELNEMKREIECFVDITYAAAASESAPDSMSVLEHLYETAVEAPAISVQPGTEPVTMVEAVNQVLHAAMDKFPNLVSFGEDIEDPKGGVFGFTKGLSSRYPIRVSNAPLAEATIVGAAVGLAASGYRPVVEIQFIDYITPAFHQLVTQMATLRWRSCGRWTCPTVIYAPYGAYLPAGGQWHSQSNDGWWAHTPGIRVAIPSTPEDAAGLFWTAIHSEDPSLLLIPKHLMRLRRSALAYRPVDFGRAVVRREGGDCTVVSWGNCLEIAEQAAVQMDREGVGVEIIDIRTLVPCDWLTIERSLAKTGRLVVIHEDNRTCGFGEAVITEMTSDPKRFQLFLAPPQLVARYDTHIPYHPDLEHAVLPTLERVIQAIRLTLE